MTRVCLVGSEDVNVRYELLSRETAREALSTYDISEPFENTVGVDTVSLGAAVSLLNDLEWYLVRFVEEAMVLEPSVDASEWLSRNLAAAIRDGDVDPAASDRYCKIYGLEPATDSDSGPDAGRGPAAGSEQPPTAGSERPAGGDGGDGSAGAADGAQPESGEIRHRLVEPMYVTRTGDGLPAYDLRDLEATLVERVTEAEFGA